MRLIFRLLLLAVLCGVPTGSARAAIKNIAILQTSDIHGHCDVATVSRLGTIIAAETARCGGRDHLLLLDTGDLLQGTFAAAASRGEIAVKALNLLGGDLWTPGNHDFDFGFDLLVARLRQFRGRIAAANLDAPGIGPYAIFHRHGLKLVVIGLTFPDLWRQKAPGEKEFRLESFDVALSRTIPAVMREKPDIIILNVHYGVSMSYSDRRNSLLQIARRYPQLDLICGGHTHQVVAGRDLGYGVWYTEPGKHGEGIAVTEIRFDTDAGRVVDLKTRLATVPDPGSPPFTVPPSFIAELRRYHEQEQQVIGSVGAPISGSVRGVGNPLQNLFGRAAAEAAGVDYALISPSLHDPVTLSGRITAGKLFATAPYEDTITVITVTLPELRQIVEEQLSWQVIPQRQLPWGFHVRRQRGGTAELMLPQHRNRYRVAVSSFIVARGRKRFPALVRAPATDTGITIRAALQRYFARHSPVMPDFTVWLDRK
ncbi:MAG: metallophosphoesterase [Victivallales bacterium]|nr:metallophosphoesterase [Victivallales bacterium]